MKFAPFSSVACSATLTLMLVVSSCGGSTDQDTQSSPAEEENAAALPVQDDVQPALPSLPKSQSLDIQEAHPNGTTVRITGISFHDDHIGLTVSVVNGGTRVSALASQGNFLVDDQNVRYRLATPSSNRKLEQAPETSQELKLVYLGRISKEARNLTFVANDETIEPSPEYSTSPNIRIGPIPVER